MISPTVHPSSLDRERAPGITRRQFVQGAAGISFALALGPRIGFGAVRLTDTDSRSAGVPYAWVNIAPDGTITIQTPAAEMGQGSMTALPVILAEELDADWKDVVIEFSPPDGRVYGDPQSGMMMTVASRSVVGYYDRLRIYGAQMRRMLLDNAARYWDIPMQELRTEPSSVVHEPTGRKLRYGEIAQFATLPEQPPEIRPDDLKPRSKFRLIGAELLRHDIEAKVNGTAEFSMDARVPGMLYAAVEYPAVHGAKLISLDAGAARKAASVREILNLGDRIGVLADSWIAAERAKRQLEIQWEDPVPASHFNSDSAIEEHATAARDLSRKGHFWEDHGDIDAAFARADRIIEREYRTAFLYHAQMEPLNGVAWCKDDGTVEVWVGSQSPTNTVRAVARAAGVEPGKVTLHRSYLGGGFGRRAAPDQDFIVDAVLLSRRSGRPVKVIWSREDDVRWARLKPMTAQFLRAGIDEDGNIIAWHHRIASDEPLAFADPERYEIGGRVPVLAMLGSEQPAYHLPNRRAEHLMMPTGMRLSPLRGTGVTPNKFASESFLDEIADEIGWDPLSLRLKLLAQHPRAATVLKTAARMAEWDRPRTGSALGLGFCEYAGTFIACVAEVAMVDKRIRVLRMWAAVDPGIAIQPDNVRAQVEGALIFGLSNALKEEITIKDGRIQQSNYDDYSLLTQAETPEISVEILQGDDRPGGIGEVGAMLAPAAVANAFAKFSSDRLRTMPFNQHRLPPVVPATRSLT